MTTGDVIDDYIDLAATGRQTEGLVQQIERVYQAFEKVSKATITLEGTKTFRDAAAAAKALATEEEKLRKATEAQARASIARSKASEAQARADKALAIAEKELQAAIVNEAKANTEAAKAAKLKAQADTEAARTAKILQQTEEAKNRSLDRSKKVLDEATRAYKSLEREYIILKKVAEDYGASLGTESRQFIEAAKRANELNTKLKAIDAGIGNYQRNVGNYASAFNPLNNSIAQIARELPSLAVSAQTFALAISNNIPALQDAITQAKADAAALNAEGKKAPSIWKQVGASLLSPQVGLSVIVALVTAFSGKLFQLIGDLFDGTDKLIRKELELNKVLKEQFDLKEQSYALLDTPYRRQQLRGLEVELARLQQIGASEDKILEIRKQLATQRVLLSQRNPTIDAAEAAEAALASALDDYRTFLEKTDPADLEDESIKNQKELFESRIGLLRQTAEAERRAANQRLEDFEEYEAAFRAIDKFNADEERKLILETAKLRVSENVAANQAILNDERRTEAERLQAVRRIADAQIAGVRANLRATLDDPSTTPKGRAIAERQAASEIRLIRQESLLQIEELERAYLLRRQQATLAAYQAEAEIMLATNEKFIADEENAFTDRLAALGESYAIRRALIGAAAAQELADQTLIAEERLAIEKKTLEQINALNLEFGEEQRQLTIKNAEAAKKAFEDAAQITLSGLSKQAATEQVALQQAFSDGLISIEDFNAQTAEIEQKYRRLSLQAEINAIQAKIVATKEGTRERAELEAQLAAKVLELSKDVTGEQLLNETKVAEARKRLQAELITAVGSITDGFFEREKNQVQDRIDQNTDEKNSAIRDVEDRLRARVITEQQAADEIAIINARSQAQAEALEQRKRQIQVEQARFARVFQVFQIAGTTAQAVVAALAPPPVGLGPVAGVPLAVTVGAIGAAQIASLLARPIPRYFDGGDHFGGPLIWGDNGNNEVAVGPDGGIRVSGTTPELTAMPAGTRIYKSISDFERAVNGLPVGGVSRMSVNERGRLEMHNDNSAVVHAVQRVEKALSKRPENHTHITGSGIRRMQKVGDSWTTYISKNT